MLLFGGVSDKIGVRVSLALSLAVMMLGRILVALSGTLSLGSGMGSPMFLLMAGGLLLMVAAYGLYMPAAYAGSSVTPIRRRPPSAMASSMA